MTDPLRDLPRLGEVALGPCACCRKPMLEAGFPLYYRVTVEHCGIDAKAIRERAGLAMMLGGGTGGLALSGVMGPGTKPVVVFDQRTGNICMNCAQERAEVVMIIATSEEAEPA